MWSLTNHTPFAADRGFARDRDGAEVWLVAVKATFRVNRDSSVEVAEEQAKVSVAAEHTGEPGQSSLAYESDLILTKCGTDVLLRGHAYAPAGLPTDAVDVTMRVGRISKTLRVIGNRYWRKAPVGLKMTDAESFLKMPITYERAYGGVDRLSRNPKKHAVERRNPVGTGFAVSRRHLVDQPLPNIEDPRALITSWRQRPPPAGFGPIAGHWLPRVRFAGTYDDRWQEERQPLVPDDFDDRFYQCAPEDQQADGFMRGGEEVELYNLSPIGVLKFNLPRAYFAFETDLGREVVEHRANLHTVILEPDEQRVIMVWHTSVRCHNRESSLERTVITQKEYLW
jgi:hypothetical protein